MSEWDQREVCPDGACVGVLSSDGTCKVCGKRGRAAAAVTTADAEGSGNALRGEATDFDEDDEYYYEDEEHGDGQGSDDDEDEDDDDDEGEPDADEEGVATVGWSDRKLCPDGGCVGVIGENGTCKVCGRRAG